MAEHREEHLTRVAFAQQAYSSFAQLNGLVNSQSGQHQSYALQIALQQQYAAMSGHSHSLSSPGHTHNLGPITASWTPYITSAEWEAFEAYMRGEDLILHVLADQRD
ncbi:hypothetical protein [Rhizobium sp. 2MFCol3.1]|uniref:hypothetical protein n=1 Tax=Rhizobium sp. 2MFCol3.1 TaxID=1246459 RepID=UPI000368549A|nr:hypothetical protein [Rhizobium sp. 2MFCol3.1]